MVRHCRTIALATMQLFATRTYERAVRKLIPESGREEMEAAIVADPGGASVIPG